MKKAKTFLLLGITLCMFGCSDDDDDKSNTCLLYTSDAADE